ncbi:MAG: hypothetical protein IRY95_00940 [Clostridia bacterium]|nr:hypothetical protein [Clostridia bacterium]
MRTSWLLVLAIVIAFSTGFGVYTYLRAAATQVPVVVAARDLPAYHRVAANDVRTTLLPLTAVHAAATANPADVIGQYTLVPLYASEPVLLPRLSRSDRQTDLLSRLPPGFGAFFLPLPEGLAATGLPAAGRFVTLIPAGNRAEKGAVAIPHVPVLDLTGENRNREGRGAILAVSGDQAELIARMLASGGVHVLVEGMESGADPLASEVVESWR